MKHPLLLALLSLQPELSEAACPSRNAPRVEVTNRYVDSRKGRGSRWNFVHPSAKAPIQCVLDGLDRIGYPVRAIYGYACRDLATSNHPRGLAIDTNQYARDKTRPPVPRRQATQIAQACNAVHGAVWTKPDAGHFEIRSLSRAQQKQKRGKRRR